MNNKQTYVILEKEKQKVDKRYERGQILAQVGEYIPGPNGVWFVESQSRPGFHYTIDKGICNCPDSMFRGVECKHVKGAKLRGLIFS
jgi:hypothetical protein